MATPAERLFETATQCLATGRAVLDRALAHLRARATVDGRISGAKLDADQLVTYDAALSAAELTGAGFLLAYATTARQKLGGGDEPILEERFALTFTAEALQSLRTRIGARPGDWGLDWAALGDTLDTPIVRDFCAGELAQARLAELGQKVREREGATGAYLLDDQSEMMRDTFRQFANDVVMPLAEEVHRHDLLIPDKILKPLTELGCFGLSIPERFGGLQPDGHEDNMGMIVVTEELSRGSLGAAGSLITRPEILTRALLAGGTKAQQDEWLPKLATGEKLCAVAVTEPDYGSDVAGMKFKATKVEGGWKLEGAKSWCTFGAKAHVLLVLARTNPDPKLGHKGLSMFLVEKPSSDGHEFEYRQPEGGLLTGRAIATIGYRGMHSYECFFEDFFVPDGALLGGEAGLGKGFYYSMAGFSGGRIQTAARAVGVMQAAFERAVSYASERITFGKPIGDYPLTQVKLARMATTLAAARQFTYAVGRLMDEGKGQMEASMVKLFASRAAEGLTREAMQIHGGMGYAEETAVSRYFVDARVLSIFEGAEEILALKVVGRALVAGGGEA